MNYNIEIHGDPLDITDESTGDFEYPVSIEEVKEYLRLEGFIDIDESTADDLADFDFDDPLIASLIKSSFQYFEKTCWLSLRPKTLQWSFTNLAGNVHFPYGPHADIIELLDDDGTEITSDNYKVVGITFKRLRYPCYKDMTISMNVGYGTEGLPELPEPLRQDIVRLVAYMYENRGDNHAIEKFASQLASVYSKKPPLV